MKRRLFWLPAVLLLFFSGCIARSVAIPETTVKAYYVNEDAHGICILTAMDVAVEAGENEFDAAIRAVGTEPVSELIHCALPEGVKILGGSIQHGRAKVELNSDYRKLNGMDRILANYAITTTLTRLDEIYAVDILCASRMIGEGLTPEDVVLSDVEYADSERTLKIFLPEDQGSSTLSCHSMIVSSSEKNPHEAVAKAVLSEMKGIPEGTRLLSAKVENGLCTLNLSEEFYTTEPESVLTAKLMIKALCNTMAYFSDVDQVMIAVNGETITNYGKYMMVWPMRFDVGICGG